MRRREYLYWGEEAEGSEAVAEEDWEAGAEEDWEVDGEEDWEVEARKRLAPRTPWLSTHPRKSIPPRYIAPAT